MYSLDIFIQNYLSSVRTGGLTSFFYLISSFFDFSTFFILMCLFISLLIYLVKGHNPTFLFILSIISSGVVVFFLKYIFDIARPTDFVIPAFGPSFPSYHATIVTVFFIILMYIFDDVIDSFSRIVFNSLSIATIFFVALSRVYLGVHWVSDVFVGIILGALISYISLYLFKKYSV